MLTPNYGKVIVHEWKSQIDLNLKREEEIVYKTN